MLWYGVVALVIGVELFGAFALFFWSYQDVKRRGFPTEIVLGFARSLLWFPLFLVVCLMRIDGKKGLIPLLHDVFRDVVRKFEENQKIVE